MTVDWGFTTEISDEWKSLAPLMAELFAEAARQLPLPPVCTCYEAGRDPLCPAHGSYAGLPA